MLFTRIDLNFVKRKASDKLIKYMEFLDFEQFKNYVLFLLIRL